MDALNEDIDHILEYEYFQTLLSDNNARGAINVAIGYLGNDFPKIKELLETLYKCMVREENERYWSI